MDLQELIAKHQEKRQSSSRVSKHHLRDREYREHYPLIKSAVQKSIPLASAIGILREDQNAFEGKSEAAVWQAYRRALLKDGITLTEKDA